MLRDLNFWQSDSLKPEITATQKFHLCHAWKGFCLLACLLFSNKAKNKGELQKKAEILSIMNYVEIHAGICLTLLMHCTNTVSAPKELVWLRGYIYIYWNQQVLGADLPWFWPCTFILTLQSQISLYIDIWFTTYPAHNWRHWFRTWVALILLLVLPLACCSAVGKWGHHFVTPFPFAKCR